MLGESQDVACGLVVVLPLGMIPHLFFYAGRLLPYYYVIIICNSRERNEKTSASCAIL